MKNPNVDEFIQSADKWSAEMAFLRRILLDCLLVETYKWRTPVYMVGSKNIIAISRLKEHCALNFFNGALLQDEEGLLIKPGEHTQLGRWMKFSFVEQILAKEDLIKAYVLEAQVAMARIDRLRILKDKSQPPFRAAGFKLNPRNYLYCKSKRSKFITFVQAPTKSFTNLVCASFVA